MDDEGEGVCAVASEDENWPCSFKINCDNMKILASLADKYIIESLHEDVQVPLPQGSLQT